DSADAVVVVLDRKFPLDEVRDQLLRPKVAAHKTILLRRFVQHLDQLLLLLLTEPRLAARRLAGDQGLASALAVVGDPLIDGANRDTQRVGDRQGLMPLFMHRDRYVAAEFPGFQWAFFSHAPPKYHKIGEGASPVRNKSARSVNVASWDPFPSTGLQNQLFSP